MKDDEQEHWMREALGLARQGAELGEVPVGALVVHRGTCVARAHNRRRLDDDPLAHAEVVALREASRTLGSWRLDDATLVVTLEPCVMCAGALVQARLGSLVFGAPDARGGGVRSLYQLCDDARALHRLAVSGPVLEAECAALLADFFAQLRQRPR